MALRASAYFKDYDLVETLDKQGRVKRKYVYRGDLYERNLSKRRRTAERYVYPFLGIVAAILLVLAMFCRTAPNRGGVWAALSLIALIPAFCTLLGSIIALFQKGNLTKGDYRERIILLRLMPLFGAALLTALAVGYALAVASATDEMERAQAQRALLYCTPAALLYAAICVREFCVKYTVHKGSKPSEERKGVLQRLKEGEHV